MHQKEAGRKNPAGLFCLLMLGGIRSMFSVRDYTILFPPKIQRIKNKQLLRNYKVSSKAFRK